MGFKEHERHVAPLVFLTGPSEDGPVRDDEARTLPTSKDDGNGVVFVARGSQSPRGSLRFEQIAYAPLTRFSASSPSGRRTRRHIRFSNFLDLSSRLCRSPDATHLLPCQTGMWGGGHASRPRLDSKPKRTFATATSPNSSTARNATPAFRPGGHRAAPFVHPSPTTSVCGNTPLPLRLTASLPGRRALGATPLQ